MIADFHLLRPWWLIMLLPIAWIGWRLIRPASASGQWRSIVAPHLLPHLLVTEGAKRTRTHAFALLAAWAVAALALAGPTWRHEPALFSEDASQVVVVLKITPSMRTQDVQPDRLSRAIQKLHDFLQARPGGRSALVAYAGSAHVVMPLTSDPSVIDTFAAALDPQIMPKEGDNPAAAFKLAHTMLEKSGRGGAVVWIVDEAAADAVAALSQSPKADVHVLAMTPATEPSASLDRAADVLGARLTKLTPDDADVQAIARSVRETAESAGDGGQRWHDAGAAMLPVVAILLLFTFREGVLGSLLSAGRSQ